MEFDSSVTLRSLTPTSLLAIQLSDEVYKKRMLVLTVLKVFTEDKYISGIEVQTRATGSTRSLLGDLRKRLEKLGYDVILVDEGTENERITISFDVRG